MSLGVTRNGRIATLTLMREPVNALNTDLYREIRDAFQSIGSSEIVHLTSAMKHFCSGQDTREYVSQDAQQRRAALELGVEAITSALRSKAPIVATVNGAAIGAGALLACAADVLIVSDDAWFQLPELTLGVSIGASVAGRTLGGALARRMLLTGEKVSAEQLAAAGVARVVPRSELAKQGEQACQQLGAINPELLATARSSWGNNERFLTAAAFEQELQDFLNSAS